MGIAKRASVLAVVTIFVAATLSLAGALQPVVAANGGYPDHDAISCGNRVWCKDGSQNSPRGYAYRNCTDFVAWKLATENKHTLPRGLGNAGEWGNRTNAAVNDTPARGSVAWWDSASHNHVAWVAALDGDHVVIEEYNWGTPGQHGTRRIHKDNPTGYIHFKDLPPPNHNVPVVDDAKFLGVSTLRKGQTLRAHEYMLSDNGRYVLMMQYDGNLVMLQAGRQVRWVSNTDGNPGAYLTVQNDGNIVIYDNSNRPLWATYRNSAERFTVQNDGNLVAYNASEQAIWATHTGGRPTYSHFGESELRVGQRLYDGQYLRSADRRYFLLVQNDGNLVLYSPGYHVLWASHTGGSGSDAHLRVQHDGNVVLYNRNDSPLWATHARITVRLVVQNDGNLVAYNSSGKAVWATNTRGRL